MMGTAVSSFVGMRLQNMRCRRGMTKKTLADLSGIDSRYITKFEVGKGLPTDLQLTAMADALDADPGYFSLEWEGGVDENGLFFRAPQGCWRATGMRRSPWRNKVWSFTTGWNINTNSLSLMCPIIRNTRQVMAARRN